MLKDIITRFVTNEYLVAIIYLVLFFIIVRVAAFVLEKIILKITVKTKTNLDDLIVKSSSRPLTILALIIGLKISISQISLSEILQNNINLVLDLLIVITVGYLFYVILNLSFSRVFSKIAKKAKTKPNEGLIQLTKSALQIILVIALFLYALTVFGFEIGPLLAGLGIGGLAIAFAMQSSLANVFGGISVILDKTIRVGDWIKLEDGTVGIILKIGLRSTKLKTFDNETLFIPNSIIANTKVQNIALPEPKSRVVIPFSVAYGSDINKVKKIIMKEIETVENFVDDPAPSVRFLEMGNSSLNFKAYFFVDSFENRFAAIDEANTKIYNALRKNKIEIPFPQMDIHMRK